MDLLLPPATATVLDRLAELERQDAQLFAAKAGALMDAEHLCSSQPDPALALSLLPLNLAMACGIAQSTATSRLEQARRLVHDLPLTHEALHRGELRIGQALVILEETAVLSPEVCREVEKLALPRVQGCTSGDTRRLVRRVVVKLDADASDRRRKQKAAERRVWESPRPDGRGFVGAEQSAEDAGLFMRSLKELASRTFDAGDDRTLDQQCADLFSLLPGYALSHLDLPEGTTGPTLRDLLGLADRGSAPGSAVARRSRRRTQTVVVTPVETALGLADSPADLVGYGPITAGHARELISASELRKACVDLRTGRMVALEDIVIRPAGHRWDSTSSKRPGPPDVDSHPEHSAEPERRAGPELEDVLLGMVERPTPVEDRDEDQHDPSQGLADFVRLRDDRCSGPGCSAPAHLCDLEHLVPHPRGRTRAANLGPVSRRCHNAKTHGGWTLTPHPDGSVTWTSPEGRSMTRPSRTVPPDLSRLRLPARRQPPPRHVDGKGSTGNGADEPDPGHT